MKTDPDGEARLLVVVATDAPPPVLGRVKTHTIGWPMVVLWVKSQGTSS